ncbi:MAG TPA: LLM class F420-dependent oxidoreductase [Acidimicrobiales bacterium]|jgi:F420-dependent oxidoreductase-like protein|nr:LLM class F420-dependent oxidoreductase [Acidimicrobiales bacterium]
MRFSIWPSPAQPWSDILDLTSHCEAAGWDGVYFADHFMPNGPDSTPLDGDTIECWSVMAALAAAVPRLRLGTLVTSVTYRHPAVLANIAAAVDQISGGRLLLGVGAGWQENEHAAYGLELGSVKERLDRFEEACELVLGLLREKRTTFEGAYFKVNDAPNQPAPVQQRLPLLIGGSGEKRTMRIAARLADEWNAWTTPEVLAHKVGVLRRHCDDVGRDASEIAVSTQALLFLSNDEAWLQDKRSGVGRQAIVGTPSEVVDIVGAYGEAGADELIIPDFTLGSGQRKKDTVDLFFEEVASQFR